MKVPFGEKKAKEKKKSQKTNSAKLQQNKFISPQNQRKNKIVKLIKG